MCTWKAWECEFIVSQRGQPSRTELWKESYCFACFCMSQVYEGSRPPDLFFFINMPAHLSKVFSYGSFFVAHLPTKGLLAHWHDSTHTSGRATGGLFYIKQYGNTPTGRKMSNKDTRAQPCYYAITYHPFLRPPFNSLRTFVVRALCILRTVGLRKAREYQSNVFYGTSNVSITSSTEYACERCMHNA